MQPITDKIGKIVGPIHSEEIYIMHIKTDNIVLIIMISDDNVLKLNLSLNLSMITFVKSLFNTMMRKMCLNMKRSIWKESR